MDEWALPETKETYTVQYKGAPWIEGGEGSYEGLSLQHAEQVVADMKKDYPYLGVRYVKATTAYEYVVMV